MSKTSRRGVLAGATGALLAASASAAERPRDAAVTYDYVFVELADGPAGAAQKRLREQAQAFAGDAGAAGGEVLGLFTPQLGWTTHQAAVLLRWNPGAGRDAAFAKLASLPGVRRVKREKLTPTLRPADGDRPQAGGIYVHRWFTVDEANAEEFVRLSGEGWNDFERRFDTRIFGLFRAEGGEQGAARLLLITRYRDHGVWETSRDPSTEAMQTFARRQQLTRTSSAASTLLAAI